MMPRNLSILILLSIPAILLGGEHGKLQYVFKHDIPDSIKGIQIQFEVKQVKVPYQGKTVDIYCLCADIINQNDRPEHILVRYECQGKPREKEVEIAGNQQRIILIDKCMITEVSPADITAYYSLVLLEYRE